MTLEEATEEVLRGPFMTCTHCNGSGLVDAQQGTLQIRDIVLEETKFCGSCKGFGKWRRGDYVQACVLLNIEPKELPKSPVLRPLLKKTFEEALQKMFIPTYRREYLGTRENNTSDSIDAIMYATAHSKRRP